MIQNIQVIVKDPSTAIDPAKLPQLFSKFASKPFEDAGLGLFTAKRIVEAHSGGKRWTENNNNNNNNNNTDREKKLPFTLPTTTDRLLDVKVLDQ